MRWDGDWLVDEHRRRIEGGVPTGFLGGLLDPAARLWPSDAWPPLVLDDGLRVGSDGGHGPIRYRVIDSDSRRVRFSFGGDREGWHEFRVEGVEGDVLVHEARLHRPSATDRCFVIQLHDALIEHLLDDAESGGARYPRRRWPGGSRWRYLLAAAARPDPDSGHRSVRRLVAGVIGSTGALHLVWAAGSSFPARTRRELAHAVIGTTGKSGGLPSAVPTAAVGAALVGLAGLVVAQPYSDVLRAAGIPSTRRLDVALRIAEAVFGARGVIGLIGPTGSRHPRYRVLNAVVYSPLCLLLAAGLHALLSGDEAAAVSSH
ncbi:DUF3995 domain-containing protein [Flexivirga endophytica]|uniref:DUF3995 domain-containing protein n=1 Tax=Flexivirga endophytica TaxID=1849103 RepID=UPI00166612FE|nr:DUF3995 domain-containing protein [Flexivirga endophytica]